MEYTLNKYTRLRYEIDGVMLAERVLVDPETTAEEHEDEVTVLAALILSQNPTVTLQRDMIYKYDTVYVDPTMGTP